MNTPTARANSLPVPRTPAAPGSVERTHTSLRAFAAAMVAGSLIVHLIIVLTGNRITILNTIPLAVLALGYATYLLRTGKLLARVRYGSLTAHAITYVAVNAGYQLHAYVLLAAGSPAIQGNEHLGIDPNWLGATMGMTGFWGIGLMIHALAAVFQRGFEAGRA